MSKVRLILGNSPEHLLNIAKTMAHRKSYVILDGEKIRREAPFAYRSCSRETEAIIIRELPVLQLPTTVALLHDGEICIHKRDSDPFTHKVDVIITCICRREWLTNHSHLIPRVTLIESYVASHPKVPTIKVPKEVASSIGEQFLKDQVIVLSWDKATESSTVTTWGFTPEDKEKADQLGQTLKSSSNWDQLQISRSELMKQGKFNIIDKNGGNQNKPKDERED